MSITFDGLASGLNTQDIISKLLRVEQQPINRLNQRKQQIQKERDAWKDLGTRLQNLASALSSLVQRSTVVGFTVRPSDSNAPFTASARPGAVAGTYSIQIQQLATSTTLRSTGPIGAEIDPNAVLNNTNLRSGVTAGSFTINGVAITVDPAVDTLNDVVDRINASGAGVVASLVTVDGRLRLKIEAATPGGPLQLGALGDTSNFLSVTSLLGAPRTGDAIVGTRSLAVVKTSVPLNQAMLATPVSGAGTLTINGVAINYDPAVDSLSTIVNRINSSNAGVTASYDATSDRVVLTAKTTGSLSITVSDTGNLATALGLDPNQQQLGQNAVYSLDGGATWQYSASNIVSDAIPGVTLTLTRTMSSPYSFTVEPDTDGAVSAVRRFVDQFNSVLSFIAEKTSYDATTKTAGTLLGDSAVRAVESTLRRLVTSPAINAGGRFRTLADVGISFGPVGSAVGTTNQLQLDESKLRAALQENPDAVFELFGATSRATLTTPGDIVRVAGTPRPPASGRYVITSDGAGNLTAEFRDQANQLLWSATGTITAGGSNTTLVPGLTLSAATTLTGATSEISVTQQEGVLTQLGRYLNGILGRDGLVRVRGDAFEQQLRSIDQQIDRFQQRLDDRKAQLVRQFATLERILAEMQTQGTQLQGQIVKMLGAS
ncbi:flagellar filament capping protein FliD [Thermomicrobium sp. CFH 73360]|uniref:flagellar filament capping protein FliD n=1 Tax=Thermomicrobium sp. CFH 73360 TaxID=2951987 RepID=UPI0020776015|nr:flagellar filament capping protein FliD [Thermomicrobium sp. CFH 73360]MCM8746970.1 flagellar filament capping protein FliD [Thermomicrobium sp. CFH 73360]